MHMVTYTSTAKELLSKVALERLLVKCRTRNAAVNITGLLLYGGGNFMQTIEGPKEAVDQLYKKIQADPDHFNIITMLNEPIEHRAFPDWSMGFYNIDSAPIADIPGYSNFLREPDTIQKFMASQSQSMQLLGVFGKTLR